MATPDQRAADLADWCSHARLHKPAILAGGTESDSQHSRSERGVGSSGAIAIAAKRSRRSREVHECSPSKAIAPV
jgi:hypothetical protein